MKAFYFTAYVCLLLHGVLTLQDACRYNNVAVKFLTKLFSKYSNSSVQNSTDTITKASFLKLLKGLSLGDVFIGCDPTDVNCRNVDLKEVHGDGVVAKNPDRLYKRRERRSAGHGDSYNDGIHEREAEMHRKHWNEHVAKCLSSNAILTLYGLNKSKEISLNDFFQICPALLQQIDNNACVHSHFDTPERLHNHMGPPKELVWGYGFLSITVISLLSLSVISIIPCLKKAFYQKVMAYLVALAVGTLAGDAMLHLIPHAFAEASSSITDIEYTPEIQLQMHYAQVWRALFVLVGVYVFFTVEQLMKLKALCGGGGHGHSHGKVQQVQRSLSEDEKAKFVSSGEEVKLQNGQSMKKVVSCESGLHDAGHPTGNDAHYHADDRHHHHHHGEKEITKETRIASVAWMVIVGDGFHNFTDGLAVGAAFSASMSSGLSTAIAVFCHELPHELGDFAILIKSGMTIKQAIVYNLVSAVLAYFGLVVGVIAGEYELGRQFILSITAGLFLYVSLADMLPELTHQEAEGQPVCSSYIFQHLGILSGITIMLFISLYEHIL